MNYEDTIKTIKEEHKKIIEMNRQYRALKKSTEGYMDRALEAAYKKGIIAEHAFEYKKWYEVLFTNNAGITYIVGSDDRGIICYPCQAGRGWGQIDLPHGRLETVLARLGKKNEVALEDSLRRLYKFLKDYSE